MILELGKARYPLWWLKQAAKSSWGQAVLSAGCGLCQKRMTSVFTQTICKSTQKFKNPSGNYFISSFFQILNCLVSAFRRQNSTICHFRMKLYPSVCLHLIFKTLFFHFVQTTYKSPVVQVGKQRAAVHPSVQTLPGQGGTHQIAIKLSPNCPIPRCHSSHRHKLPSSPAGGA